MTQYDSPSAAVAARVRALRGARSWSAERLAERCAELGYTSMNRSVIANIENGRRTSGVSIDECVVLALALDVALVDLITPNGPEDSIGVVKVPEDSIGVTGRIVNVGDYREWLTGMTPFPDTDGAYYWTQPWSGAERDYQLLGQYIAERDALSVKPGHS